MEKGYLNNLADQAKELVEQLEAGNPNDALQTIQNLQSAHFFGLYQEIGKLTRSLHDAIVNFQIDAGIGMSQEEMSRMADASDRLSFVIEKTENAANKTMDMVEDTIPINQELGETAARLKQDWQRLIKRELTAEEFRNLYREIDGFLDFATNKTGEIGGNLSNILMAQDYQDITGQVIKKVITLVQEVEERLVDMVKMAAAVEDLTGIKHEEQSKDQTESEKREKELEGEGPVINPDDRSDVVTSQDDVDDLLSSLGF